MPVFEFGGDGGRAPGEESQYVGVSEPPLDGHGLVSSLEVCVAGPPNEKWSRESETGREVGAGEGWGGLGCAAIGSGLFMGHVCVGKGV